MMEKEIGSVEMSLITKAGRSIPTEYTAGLIRDKEGNPEYIIAIGRDITERKEAEKALKKSEEQLHQALKLEGIGQLASGIAHDLNNILTAIIGNTELAFKGLEKGKKIHDNLEQVMVSGMKASELVTKILAFSRKQIIYPEVIDVNSVILNLSKTLKRVISEDIKIEMNLQSNISPIKADPTQIDQILINLIVNAQDAIKQKKKREAGKVITMETAEVFLDKEYVSSHVGSTIGQHILISVTDSGIGIDKEIIKRIFEPFFTTKKKGEGTGLGLSTVYGIVKQNNSSIYVYSEPGEGTTIKIYWPAFKEKTRLKEKVKRKKLKDGSETILFVEDDDTIRKASEQLLISYGYKVFSALNGRLALDLVINKNIRIDMLVTDVIMPEIGGIELSEKLKEIYPGLKVLYCSGYPDNHLISLIGVVNEDVNFIPKPYSSKELAKKIREILDKKNL
jgi:signal transduction histidine kinase